MVEVTDRGLITGVPAFVRPDTKSRAIPIEAWAGPWPIDELWWDPSGARHVARFQIVGVDGSAWLMIIEGTQWWTEAEYV